MSDPSEQSGEPFGEEFLQRLEYLRMVAQKMAAGQFRARRRTETVGSGIDFADHRSYNPGDAVKNIDWRVYHRSEKLFVKQYEEQQDLHVYFLVDTSRSMHLGDAAKWHLARDTAAALAYIALSNLDRVSIVPFSSAVTGRLAPTRGRSQIFKIFDFLGGIEPGGETSTADAFGTFVRENKRPGLAVVISDFYDPEGFEKGLDVLRYHRFEPMVIQLFDRREFSVSITGDVQLVDCETGSARRMVSTPSVGAELKGAFEQFSENLENYCTRHQMLYFQAPVQQSFEDLVLDVFRAGGFLD